MESTQNVATTEQATETQAQEKHNRNSPDAVEFARIWNASESRADALTRFANAGYDMSYSAMVARVKAYGERGVHLKEIKPAARGRRLDVSAVNAAIDAQTAPKNEGEQSPVANVEK